MKKLNSVKQAAGFIFRLSFRTANPAVEIFYEAFIAELQAEKVKSALYSVLKVAGQLLLNICHSGFAVIK